MSRRFTGRNAFETTLSNTITAGDTAVILTSATGLVTDQPGYLVLEDEDPNLREYIRYESITGNTLNNCSRGLAGSANGAQGHSSGAIVRSVAVHQWLEQLFDDIEDLEAADISLGNDLTVHIADASDPHAAAGYLDQTDGDGRYLQLTGGTVSGGVTFQGINSHQANINMGGNRVRDLGDPATATDAVSEQYGDGRYVQQDADNVVGTNFRLRGVDLPTEDGEVATKKYVDDNIGGGGTVEGVKCTKSTNQVGVSDNDTVTFDGTDFDDSLAQLANNRIALGEGRWIVGGRIGGNTAVSGPPTVLQLRLNLVGTGPIASTRVAWFDSSGNGPQLGVETIIDVPAAATEIYDIRVGLDGGGTITLDAADCQLYAHKL